MIFGAGGGGGIPLVLGTGSLPLLGGGAIFGGIMLNLITFTFWLEMIFLSEPQYFDDLVALILAPSKATQDFLLEEWCPY